MQDNLAEQIPVNDLDPVVFDRAIREMLMNWSRWQRRLPEAAPSPVPGPQPQFREVVSAPSVEDRPVGSEAWPRFAEAEYTEAVITRMSPHDRSVLVRYFINHQSTVVCAERMHMSRRKFEKWLNTAVGKFSARIEDDDEGMAHAFNVMIEQRMI